MTSVVFGRCAVLATALVAFGCSDDASKDSPANGAGDAGAGGAGATGDAAGPTAPVCDTIVADADCDETLRPIVFIHGTYGSATEISNTARLFGSNGYCQDRFVAVEYDSLGGSPIQQLTDLVDDVLAKTGFDQVDLAAHSQGTGHACTYLSEPDHAAKVAHYLNISGVCAGQGVPTLSLSSENDLRGGPIHPTADNVTQATLVTEDHVALAGSRLGFIEMFRYLRGSDPEHTTIQCGDSPITIDGKMVSLGDNVPVVNGWLEIYDVDSLDSPWERGEPLMKVDSDANGRVHVELERGRRYEFRQFAPDGTLLGNTYRAPLMRSDYLARFLSESTSPVVAGATSDRIPRSAGSMVIAARYLAGVFRNDWDNQLKIDGQQVLTDDNASRDGNVTGLFLYDDNANGESEFGVVYNLSFLWHSDVFVDASTPRWVEVEWTNEEHRSSSLRVPNWPSTESFTSVYLPY